MSFFKRPLFWLLLLQFFFLSQGLFSQWHLPYENNGAIFSSAALNHIRYGLSQTKGQDVGGFVKDPAQGWPTNLVPSTEFKPYGHHPPALALSLSLIYKTISYQPFLARLFVIFFHLGTTMLLFFILKRYFDEKTLFWILLFFVTIPLSSYFGRNVCHEAPGLFFITLALYFLDRNRLVLMIGSLVLGCFFAWPVFWANAILMVYLFFVKKQKREAAILFLATLLCSLVIFWQITALIGFTELERAFWARTVMETQAVDLSSPSILAWIQRFFYYVGLNFGFVIVLGVLGLASWKKMKPCVRDIISYFIFIAGAHVLIFLNGAYFHPYWQFYSLPAMSILAGIVVVRLSLPLKIAMVFLLFSHAGLVLAYYHTNFFIAYR